MIFGAIAAMFRIVPSPTFRCKVNLSVPGSELPQVVTVDFRHKSGKQLQAWFEGATVADSDASFLGEVIEGWIGVVDEKDAPVPYTLENLARLLDAYPASGRELVLAYQRQLRDARAKN